MSGSGAPSAAEIATLRVREVMTPDPVTLDADMSLREAVEMLDAEGISGAPVLTGGRIVGVVSLRDVVTLAASSSPARAEEPEWPDVEDDSAGRPDEDQFPGAYFAGWWMDTEGDVWTRVSEAGMAEGDVLEEHTVSEVMTPRVIGLSKEATVAEAAKLMVDQQVHRLLVLDGDDLVGVVSTLDVLRAVAGAERA